MRSEQVVARTIHETWRPARRDITRSHEAVWNWIHTLSETQAEPSRVTVDEKQITVDGEKKWLYAAIDRLQVAPKDQRGQPSRGSPLAAFLYRLTEKHDVSDTEFLTDAGGYLTALARLDLRGGLNYSERNFIEKWFQTVVMRIDRFHSSWRGSSASAGAGCDGSGTTTTTIDRIKHSMDERLSRRFPTRQCV